MPKRTQEDFIKLATQKHNDVYFSREKYYKE